MARYSARSTAAGLRRRKPSSLRQRSKLRKANVFYSRLAASLIVVAIILIGAAMTLFSLGIHAPFLKSIVPQPSDPQASAAIQTKRPKLVTAPPIVGSCDGAAQTDSHFATCPDFYVTYANRQHGAINTDMFNVYVGPAFANGEQQYYTNKSANLRVQNGSLLLEAHNQAYEGYNYTSARIDTLGKEDFLYGKLVVRAVLPSGIGTWPAIWMLPSQPKYAKLSPRPNPNDGEIDIAESIGLQPHVVYGVAHSLAYPENGVDRSYYNTVTVPGNDHAFHNYEIDWTPTAITYRIDGRAYYAYHKAPHADWRSWPFDQPFYLIINLALGGGWAGSDTADFPDDGINKGALPAALKVQSIQYYSFTAKH